MNINTKNTEKVRKAWIDTADLETMIAGVSELSRKLWDEVYGETPNGVMFKNEKLTQGENAIDFIYRNYELTAGALLTISSTTGMIAKMLTNGDASIVFNTDDAAATE